MENNFLKDFLFLSLIFLIFLFLKHKIKQKIEIREIKKEIKRWWEDSGNKEIIFQEKIRFFLEEYPNNNPENKKELERNQEILEEIKKFFERNFFENNKLSSLSRKEIGDILEKKKEKLSFL